MPELKLYNSLSRKKEAFRPLDPKHIRLYACGPTVYSYAHIGNARMAVVFDLLANVLRGMYPKVTYASNITDVDDKIIAAANEAGVPINEITEKYARIYNEDMKALGVAAPDVQPKATEHIPEMIELIQKLIKKGYAYEKEGHVLFNVPKFEKYGDLSGRSRDEQIAGARVEVAPYKKDPADFVLWKPAKPGEQGFSSPWGQGRPGWHIECSAMSEKHLGLPFDIHGGGADLKFPHHENEIAQSCCAHGSENDLSGFAKYWVHNGFVTVEGEKMAKSEGNVRLVHELIKHYPGEVLRLALLSAHYRQPLDWSETLLSQTKSFLDTIYRTLYDMHDIEAEYPDKNSTDPRTAIDLVMDALCDDLNTAKAIAAINFINTKRSNSKNLPKIKAELLTAGKHLGILQQDPAEWLGYGQADAGIDKLLAERTQAKKNKNFARADEIRDELSAQGIMIEDTPQGPKWRKAK